MIRGKKKSTFIQDTSVPDTHFFDTFGEGVNRKISKPDLFKQIRDNAQTFIYNDIADLQAANLEADPDDPVFVRVAETGFWLYKITSLAATAEDISLANGTTATRIYEETAVIPLSDITSIAALNPASLVDGQQFDMTGWRPGSKLGGDPLVHDPSRPQTDHDGGTVFALGATPPTDFNDPAQIEAYLNAGSGLSGNGCLVRQDVSDEASLFWYGLADTLPDTSAIFKAAYESGFTKITGSGGPYKLSAAPTVSNDVKLTGPILLEKLSKDSAILAPIGSDITLEFNGVSVDGGYEAGQAESTDDIDVSGLSGGSVVILDTCVLQRSSQHSLTTGFQTQGSIHEIAIKRTLVFHNGRPKTAASSAGNPHAIDINNVDICNVDVLIADGTIPFDVGDGTQGTFVSSPPMALFATNTKVTVRNADIKNSAGIVLYLGCDNSRCYSSEFKDTYYGWRVQNSSSCGVEGSNFEGVLSAAGAVTYSPYARLGGVGDRAENGIRGFDIKSCKFRACRAGVSALGNHISSGTSGVTDTRLYGLLISDCDFIDIWTHVIEGQDAEITVEDTYVKDAWNNDVSPVSGENGDIRYGITAAGGGLPVRVRRSRFDGFRGTAGIFRRRSTLNAIEPQLDVEFDDIEVDGYADPSTITFYTLYASTAKFNDIRFLSTPTQAIRSSDNNRAEVSRIKGLGAPISDPGLIRLDAGTIGTIVADHRQQADRSEFWTTGAPASTSYGVGSIAWESEPVAAGVIGYVLVSGGTWKTFGTIEA